MKTSLLFIITFFSLEAFACDCDILNSTLEFYESEYVFKGIAETKVYAEDLQTYDITFKVIKHYKQNDENLKYISFKLKAESEFSGTWTSCDWSVCKNQTWLVYARKDSSGELVFSGSCSNSRALDRMPLSQKQEAVLNKANGFKLSNYVYSNEPNFTYTNPKINLDSIFNKSKIKSYEKSFAWLKLYIDSKGNLIDIIPPKNLRQIKDKANGLTREVINTNNKPISLFERDAIELLSKVKKWEVKRHKNTNTPVSYLKHISIEYDNASNKWRYEF